MAVNEYGVDWDLEDDERPLQIAADPTTQGGFAEMLGDTGDSNDGRAVDMTGARVKRDNSLPAGVRWYDVYADDMRIGWVVKSGSSWRAVLADRPEETATSGLFGTVTVRPAASPVPLGHFTTRKRAVSEVEWAHRELRGQDMHVVLQAQDTGEMYVYGETFPTVAEAQDAAAALEQGNDGFTAHVCAEWSD